MVSACSLITVGVLMAVAFIAGRATGRYSVIDALWGPGFAVVAALAFLLSLGAGDPLLRWLLLAMVGIWGLRLGGYLLLRNRGLPQDPRYTDLLENAGGPAAIVRKVQVPQGLTMWFVSLPVQVGMLLPGPAGWVIWLGLAVYLLGLFFEVVGDWQLAAFKKAAAAARAATGDGAHRDAILDGGLWRYTRHPNYFGDACVWTGIFLTVTWSWVGWLTVLSPVLMIWLLTAKTGKAMTEQRMAAARPGYADYVARTSGFVPLPPRRKSAGTMFGRNKPPTQPPPSES